MTVTRGSRDDRALRAPRDDLFVQIERVLKINDLNLITSDVVEAARSTLVIGDT